ncbi:MAG: TlpA disulfide reductase family protein [Myxococcota bacterium]
MSDCDDFARRRAMLGLAASSLAWSCGGRVADPDPAAAPPPATKPTPDAPAAALGLERIGTPAPPWDVPFVGGAGPTLSSLRGRAVLLRFWTDTCPFCRATAPALVAIDDAFRDRNVTVVGMYHPKPRGTQRSAEDVGKVARDFGFVFPVGLDLQWAVLDAYWLSLPGRRYTSVSFVIDPAGIIQFVHPGPEFHPDGPADHEQCRRDYEAVTAALEAAAQTA